jgi:hypothetical protein
LTRIRALVAGIALALIVAAPTMAASTNITLVVTGACSIEAFPASLDFGSTLGGATLDKSLLGIDVSANGAATFTSSMADLSNGGSGSIPKDAVTLNVGNGASQAADGATIYVFDPSGGAASVDINLHIAVPAQSQAGTYNGLFAVNGSC